MPYVIIAPLKELEMDAIGRIVGVLERRGMSTTEALVVAEKYMGSILCELQVQYDFPTNDLTKQFVCSITNIRKKAGQMRVNGKRVRIYDYLFSNADTRVLNIVATGHTKRLSKVEINPDYLADVIKAISDIKVNNKKETSKPVTISSDEFTVSIPIDLKSLRNFIDQSQQNAKKHDNNPALKNTIIEEMLQATAILSIANDYEEVSRNKKVIVETWRECENGRMYGLGKTIQSMSSRVREAALGSCYRYDFKACSYGVLASLARQINPDIKVGFIKEYVRKRQQIRAAIAKDINVPEKTVKEVFTMIGFGAKLISLKETAMGSVIDRKRLEQMKNSRRFADIYNQLEDCKQTILNYEGFKGDFELGGKLFTERDEQNKKKNSNQRLAFIYQRFERLMLDMVCDNLPEDVVLLKVHDCVYTKRKILQNEMENIQTSIAKMIDIFGIEEKKVEPFGTNFLKPEIRNELKDHDSSILQEEMAARLWATKKLT